MISARLVSGDRSMLARNIAWPIELLFLFALCAFGQAAPVSENVSNGDPSSGLKPGVVVEKVAKNSEAEEAGIHEGDILLLWKRDGFTGRIESPFDLRWLEVEQRPRGPLTLEGLRGTEQRTWTPGLCSRSMKKARNWRKAAN